MVCCTVARAGVSVVEVCRRSSVVVVVVVADGASRAQRRLPRRRARPRRRRQSPPVCRCRRRRRRDLHVHVAHVSAAAAASPARHLRKYLEYCNSESSHRYSHKLQVLRKQEIKKNEGKRYAQLSLRSCPSVTRLFFTTKCDSKKTEQKQDVTKLN